MRIKGFHVNWLAFIACYLRQNTSPCVTSLLGLSTAGQQQLTGAKGEDGRIECVPGSNKHRWLTLHHIDQFRVQTRKGNPASSCGTVIKLITQNHLKMINADLKTRQLFKFHGICWQKLFSYQTDTLFDNFPREGCIFTCWKETFE